MNKDTIEGKVKKVAGKVQDAKGDLTNDPSDDVKGKMKQVEGELQEQYGKAKSAVRNADEDVEA